MGTETLEDLETLSKIFIDLQKQFSVEVFGMGIAGAYSSYLYAMAQAAKRQGRDENEAYEEGIDYLKKMIEVFKSRT